MSLSSVPHTIDKFNHLLCLFIPKISFLHLSHPTVARGAALQYASAERVRIISPCNFNRTAICTWSNFFHD